MASTTDIVHGRLGSLVPRTWRVALGDWVKALRPDDAAWVRFAPKLANAWLENVQHDVRGGNLGGGGPREKNKAERFADETLLVTLSAIASDWPGVPLGVTTSAVRFNLGDGFAEVTK